MMHIENAPTECPNCGSDFLDEDRAGTADLTIWCYDCDWTVTADEDDMSITVSKWTTKNIGDPEKKTTDIGEAGQQGAGVA